MGFGGPNHRRCSGKTTLVARSEGIQLYLQANSDQDKTLRFLYPSPAHTTNHSINSLWAVNLTKYLKYYSLAIAQLLFTCLGQLWGWGQSLSRY